MRKEKTVEIMRNLEGLKEQNTIMKQLKVLCTGKVISQWNQIAERMTANIYKFARKALIFSLPTRVPMARTSPVQMQNFSVVSATLRVIKNGLGLDRLGQDRTGPHSRPSSYVDMGLDSTVVYGAVDMKFKNNFDFPVVFHVDVQGGKVQVELLGPKRPYRVAFEREIEEVLPYTTIVRHDDRLRVGSETVAQRGKRGFKVKRTRKLYDGGTIVGTEEWSLSYPPTREIIRRGTNPSGAVPEAKPAVTLRDPANELRIVQ